MCKMPLPLFDGIVKYTVLSYVYFVNSAAICFSVS